MVTKAGKQSLFCSLSCRSKYYSKSTLEKRTSTNISRYGADNPSKNKDVIAQRSANNVIKYGVENPFKLECVQKLQQTTMISRYGKPFATQIPDFFEKQQKVWHDNYGGNPLLSAEIRSRRKRTLLDKYGVEHPIQSNEICSKIKATMLQRYGHTVASKSQEIIKKIRTAHMSSAVREKIRNTCLLRYGTNSYMESTLTQYARSVLGNQDLFTRLVQTHGILELADQLSVSVDTIRSRILQYNIKLCFKSGVQQEVLSFINSLGNFDVQTDTRMVISPSELDIYLQSHSLAIEVNGSYWHSELNGRDRHYHLGKLQKCSSKNIRLFFVWEHLWRTKKDIVKSKIKNMLSLNQRIYARKCTVKPVSKDIKRDFFNKNHLQGDVSTTLDYGLYYEKTLCAVMSFSKSRYTEKYQWELTRYACMLDFAVVGGAGKLFSTFVKNMNPESVVSYSDKQYNTGNMYEKIGFTKHSTSRPGYFYTKNYREFHSRIKFQKHKLNAILESFDQTKSEWCNMKNNGFDRIWDCGTDVWVWNAR